MKIKILAACSAVVILTSCGRDRDLMKNISDSTAVVYMPQAVKMPSVYSFDITGKADTIIYGACYGGPHSPGSDIAVQFRTDVSLLDHFNASNFTNYPILPEGSYELEQSSSVIPAGKYSTPPLKLSVHVDKLDGVGSYLLPVSITTAAKVNESLRTTYFLINAKYTSNPFPAFDRSAWKVTGFSSEETTGEGTANGRTIYALDGNDDTFWSTQWKTAKPGPPHHIIIDMQNEQKLHGFTFTGRTDKATGEVKASGNPKNIIVQTSNDGNTWDYSASFILDNNKLSTIYLAYARKARYFKIIVNTSQGDSYLTNIAELNAF